MNQEESRIYKSITQEPFHKVAQKVLRWTEEGRDVNFRDARGRTYLHVVAELAEKFRDPRAVPVVYQLCLAGIDVDAVDDNGNTCLHLVVRREGCYRLVISLLRCGADPTIPDRQMRTAADILMQEKPLGWEETLHWLNKFSHGLKQIFFGNNKIELGTVERLLSYWCRLIVYSEGSMVDILEMLKKADDTTNNDVINLLHRHRATNELAIAVLATSRKRIEQIAKKGGADVNTMDMSYQYHYPHSPEVAQPLIAAAWELNNYDVIDSLMNLNPNTNLLYSNHRDRARIPLFFHVVCGRPKPDSARLLHRIIRGSDLSKKNHKGQTILYEAVKQRLHPNIVKAIIQYGVDITARDHRGRTARDYACASNLPEYTRVIDDHVIHEIHQLNVEFIEHVAVMAYDHVTDVVNEDTVEAAKLRDRLKENRLYKDVAKSIQELSRMERIYRRAHQAVDECNINTIKKYLTDRVPSSRNKCGQTLLHRAVLSRDIDTIKTISCACPELINVGDNLERTPLHYSNLIFGGEDDISKLLLEADAQQDVVDVLGRLPELYRESNQTTHEYSALLKSVVEFQSSILLREMNFEEELGEAIKVGDKTKVANLVIDAKKFTSMVPFSSILFDCVDQRQPDIARQLLDAGFDPDIWKSYEICDPTSDACALSRCRHPVTSLQQRCNQLAFSELAEYVDQLRKIKMNDASGKQTSNAFQMFANHGVAI